MSVTDHFWTYPWYHLPSLLLAALMYSIIARYLIDLFFSDRPDVVLVRAFRAITDPALKLVRAITPAIVPDGLCIVLALVWLMALRMFWFITAVAMGMRLAGGAT